MFSYFFLGWCIRLKNWNCECYEIAYEKIVQQNNREQQNLKNEDARPRHAFKTVYEFQIVIAHEFLLIIKCCCFFQHYSFARCSSMSCSSAQYCTHMHILKCKLCRFRYIDAMVCFALFRQFLYRLLLDDTVSFISLRISLRQSHKYPKYRIDCSGIYHMYTKLRVCFMPKRKRTAQWQTKRCSTGGTMCC